MERDLFFCSGSPAKLIIEWNVAERQIGLIRTCRSCCSADVNISEGCLLGGGGHKEKLRQVRGGLEGGLLART